MDEIKILELDRYWEVKICISKPADIYEVFRKSIIKIKQEECKREYNDKSRYR